jgi:Thioredoxin domain
VKVEVLYMPQCPSHPAAVKLVKDVLSEEGVAAQVSEVLVSNEIMAKNLAFRGSPTIRINGRDVAGESSMTECFALSCRLYPGSQQIGLPPVDLVRRAVLESCEGKP